MSVPRNPANIYCCADDIADLISQSGIDLRIDDMPPHDLGNALSKAGNLIDRYLYRRYQPAQLMLSDLIKDCAAALAAYFLCVRRGNDLPNGVAALYEDCIAYLTELKKGDNEVPGIPARKSYTPVYFSMRATLRPFPRAVVEQSRGSHATGGSANFPVNSDAWDTYGWNSHGWLDNTI